MPNGILLYVPISCISLGLKEYSYQKGALFIAGERSFLFYAALELVAKNYTLISTSTPQGSSSFMRASMVFAVLL